MFTANTELQVSNMDFQSIKNNLIDFIKTKTEFQDYDFEGSTINYLVDLLSYNTYMNSFYTNMAINESFLDTAQLRSNVVSNAKKLGYVPKSASAAVAKVTVSFSPNDNPSEIKIPKKTKFFAKKDGVDFNFVTKQDYIVQKNNNSWKGEISIHEGEYFTQNYDFNENKEFYEILEKGVDISSLTVGIKPNQNSTQIEYWTKADSIIDVDGVSPVFFLQENSSGRYEIYFGNGVIGKSPATGNVIILDYFVTRGKLGNNIASFTPVGYSGENLLDSSKKYTASSVITSQRSTLGVDQEEISSIRFNAPNNYFYQNRLVTKTDYEVFIKKNYPQIESLNVWGGEDHWQPIYGKVILTMKPYDGYALPIDVKNEIVSQIKSRGVMSIEPLIVDPIFIFVKPTIRVNFEQSLTTQTSIEVYEKLRKRIVDFESNQLGEFEKSFRYSYFVKLVDATDSSIVSNEVEIELEKRFAPIFGSAISYTLQFDSPVKRPYVGYLGSLTSTGYRNNKIAELLYLEDNGKGTINSYYYAGGDRNKKVIFEKNVGTINYDTGLVKLNGIHFTGVENDEQEMKVRIVPNLKDYTQTKNQIILLTSPTVRVYDDASGNLLLSRTVSTEGDISPIISSAINGAVVL